MCRMHGFWSWFWFTFMFDHLRLETWNWPVMWGLLCISNTCFLRECFKGCLNFIRFSVCNQIAFSHFFMLRKIGTCDDSFIVLWFPYFIKPTVYKVIRPSCSPQVTFVHLVAQPSQPSNKMFRPFLSSQKAESTSKIKQTNWVTTATTEMPTVTNTTVVKCNRTMRAGFKSHRNPTFMVCLSSGARACHPVL